MWRIQFGWYFSGQELKYPKIDLLHPGFLREYPLTLANGVTGWLYSNQSASHNWFQCHRCSLYIWVNRFIKGNRGPLSVVTQGSVAKPSTHCTMLCWRMMQRWYLGLVRSEDDSFGGYSQMGFNQIQIIYGDYAFAYVYRYVITFELKVDMLELFQNWLRYVD